MATVMRSTKFLDAVTLSAGASNTSNPIPLDNANGFAVHLTSVAGTAPNVSFTYSVSADGTTYVTPSVPVTIGTGLSAADVLDFAPEASKWMKIITTNNSGNSVTLSAFLCVQEVS